MSTGETTPSDGEASRFSSLARVGGIGARSVGSTVVGGETRGMSYRGRDRSLDRNMMHCSVTIFNILFRHLFVNKPHYVSYITFHTQTIHYVVTCYVILHIHQCKTNRG